MHRKVLQQYREYLHKAIAKTGLRMPYLGPIELSIVYVNPTSPDIGNLYSCTERCFDGKALDPPYILADDSQIQVLHHVSKMYTGGVTEK
jgi:Holliday junction resolvase RusA-like endonuclease